MSRYEKLADLKPSEKGNTDFEQVFAAATISEGSTNSSSEREPPLKGWEKVNVRSTSSTSTSTSTSSSASNSGVGDNTTTEQKPHKSNCLQWEAIRAIEKRDGNLCPSHFEVENQIGEGSIGTVFRAKLEDTGTYFAMKVMNRQILSKRGKLKAVKNELEILQLLDHPFLPTLYFYFEVNDYSVLVMEYCPGGDLYALQQRRPKKIFTERETRFYGAEVLIGLEYLHMLGVVYRDLKPENVLIREDGHIMLTDFDLSMRTNVSPTVVTSSSDEDPSKRRLGFFVQPICNDNSFVDTPCGHLPCLGPCKFTYDSKTRKTHKHLGTKQHNPFPEIIAEPTSARSMSFVGTYEYLAPEVVKVNGHGSAVDWWTFGVFLYELLFGRTPFKGSDNESTSSNVVEKPLTFPKNRIISFAAKDLIRGLLMKNPEQRLGFNRGASEIKQHPFFEGTNWALVRCITPPVIPKAQ